MSKDFGVMTTLPNNDDAKIDEATGETQFPKEKSNEQSGNTIGIEI